MSPISVLIDRLTLEEDKIYSNEISTEKNEKIEKNDKPEKIEKIERFEKNSQCRLISSNVNTIFSNNFCPYFIILSNFIVTHKYFRVI
jgi:hypothetical protein